MSVLNPRYTSPTTSFNPWHTYQKPTIVVVYFTEQLKKQEFAYFYGRIGGIELYLLCPQ